MTGWSRVCVCVRARNEWNGREAVNQNPRINGICDSFHMWSKELCTSCLCAMPFVRFVPSLIHQLSVGASQTPSSAFFSSLFLRHRTMFLAVGLIHGTHFRIFAWQDNTVYGRITFTTNTNTFYSICNTILSGWTASNNKNNQLPNYKVFSCLPRLMHSVTFFARKHFRIK